MKLNLKVSLPFFGTRSAPTAVDLSKNLGRLKRWVEELLGRREGRLSPSLMLRLVTGLLSVWIFF